MNTFFMIAVLIIVLITMVKSFTNSSNLKKNTNLINITNTSISDVLVDIKKSILDISNTFKPFKEGIISSMSDIRVVILKDLVNISKSITDKHGVVIDRIKLINDKVVGISNSIVSYDKKFEIIATQLENNNTSLNALENHMDKGLLSIETFDKNAFTDLSSRLTTIEQQNIKILELLSKPNAKIPTTRNRSNKD